MVSPFDMEDDRIAREKRKARELRHSTWWRRKIAAGICYYCGRKFQPGELTMDHKIPLGRGGSSDKINIVPACKECNNKKKYQLPTEWDEYMQNLKLK
ncbi:MAG: HNH endonuclease [Spirochaetes bacterium RBG_13_51_14]|nr:MAG: HNH endonuclease [Spirochaetes bacterium RBG_13_51_14]